MRIALLAMLFAVGCTSSRVVDHVGATPAKPQATLGMTYTLDSKILGEKRTINVYVPPDYSMSARYPVLYMPDGGMNEDFPHVVGSVDVSIKNAIIRPVIVVGIQNTERRRDLVGPTTLEEEKKIAPHAGGADRFRQFIRDELKPFIAAHYAVSGESALVGESFAGLFVVETLLVDPTLFDGYISADPSVFWNEQSLVDNATMYLARFPADGRPRHLYVATADWEPTQQVIANLLTAMRQVAPPGLTWTYEPMPTEHHSTIFPTAALHGIRTLFAAPPDAE
ncbi:MAG TPA: alpha/beta hydrolase-fold protein [Kofleriaceae bacterium]|nr:alpha/beta hydrolase-fold protein [Kofleriaceae bacterium]